MFVVADSRSVDLVMVELMVPWLPLLSTEAGTAFLRGDSGAVLMREEPLRRR